MPKAPKLTKLSLRRKPAPEKTTVVPKITNESIAEHREEVLGRARKFASPLRHSRNRIVKLSIGIAITTLIIFFIGSCLALYKFRSTSSFTYGITRIIPFPVAYADGRFVSYESYLFELRHYIHYYQTQQNVNFSTSSGQRQLAVLRQRSLDQAIDRAYVAKLAKQHDVHVLPAEVNAQVDIARNQNRLGASDGVFQSVLKDFWGWSVSDFKHELKLELLDQKVAATLDTATTKRAQNVYKQLQQGADFAKLAQVQSDDTTTKKNGGTYNFTITEANRDLSPLVVQEAFKLNQGEMSSIIDTGYTLEIIKVLKVSGQKRQVAHIAFNYKDISTYVQPLRKQHKPTSYIGTN
ncbi:hypothetical protein BH09PAT4_BH09PAT4_08360 [soil metagenome]